MDYNSKYTGKIKMFNGSFGFIESEIEDVFSHRKNLLTESYISKGDMVEFNIEPSTKFKDKFQAKEIKIIYIEKKDENSTQEPIYENFGSVL